MKHIKSYADELDAAPYHPHPAWRPANPPLNEAEINKAAMADMDTLFWCWMRNGDPDMDVRILNPDAPPRKIKHFHTVHQHGVWASDLGGAVASFPTQFP